MIVRSEYYAIDNVDYGVVITKEYLLHMLQDLPEEHPTFQAGLLVLEHFCDDHDEFAKLIARLK